VVARDPTAVQPQPSPAPSNPRTTTPGGEGVGYHDAEAANQGGQYRTADGVDIEACTDTGGGYNIGWTNAGEWMRYTVNVATAGTYTVSFRVANGATANGTFHLQNTAGTNLSGFRHGNAVGWMANLEDRHRERHPAGRSASPDPHGRRDELQHQLDGLRNGGGGAPGIPGGVTAVAANTQVTVSWTTVSGAASYNIYRSLTPGNEGNTVFANTSATSYLNTGLTNGTPYYYKVAAVNASGTSGQSSEVQGTPNGGVAGIDLLITSVSLNPTSPTSGSHVVFSCVVQKPGIGRHTGRHCPRRPVRRRRCHHPDQLVGQHHIVLSSRSIGDADCNRRHQWGQLLDGNVGNSFRTGMGRRR